MGPPSCVGTQSGVSLTSADVSAGYDDGKFTGVCESRVAENAHYCRGTRLFLLHLPLPAVSLHCARLQRHTGSGQAHSGRFTRPGF